MGATVITAVAAGIAIVTAAIAAARWVWDKRQQRGLSRGPKAAPLLDSGPTEHSDSSPEEYRYALLSVRSYADPLHETLLRPCIVRPNEKLWIVVKVKNTGTVEWKAHGSAPTRLGTWNPRDHFSPFYVSGWRGGNRAAELVETDVAPGHEGTFEFPVRAPSEFGDHVEYFNLVAENWTWAPDMGIAVELHVRASERGAEPNRLAVTLGPGAVRDVEQAVAHRGLGANPIGRLDHVLWLDAKKRIATVDGWVIDPLNPNAAVEVTLMLDGEALVRAIANHPRPDVADRFELESDHGFSVRTHITSPGRLSFKANLPGRDGVVDSRDVS